MSVFWRCFDKLLDDIWKAVTPYVIIALACIGIVMAFTGTATIVPQLMGMTR